MCEASSVQVEVAIKNATTAGRTSFRITSRESESSSIRRETPVGSARMHSCSRDPCVCERFDSIPH